MMTFTDCPTLQADQTVSPESREAGGAPALASRALVIDGDTRSASHFKETLDRMGVETTTARTIADGVAVAAQHPPHLLVVALPERDRAGALSLAGELSLRHGTSCIFVLDRADPVVLLDVAEAGAYGILCKPVHREQLEATFRLALEQHGGRRRASRQAEDARVRLLENAFHRIAQELARVELSDRPDPVAMPLYGLRPREQEVVRLLLQHLRVPAIARRLGISQQTVRNHLKSVFRRTGVRSQQELLDRIALASASHPSDDLASRVDRPGDDGAAE
jgi:DNA-binding NarL/FixJ family response regulator